jgi:DNA-binding transcriptional regulator YhcF (GntR family)
VGGLDHDSGEPLYKQLAALLRVQIKEGRLTGRVPSVKSLAQDHGVSHITAEKALAILRQEGIIRAVVGKGHYVSRAR